METNNQNPNIPIQSQQPIKLDHKSWLARHLLAEVLAVVVLVTLTATGLYYRSLVDEPIINPPKHHPVDRTKDWKTYTNSQYGFELKYPKQWTPEVCGPDLVLLEGGLCETDAPYYVAIQILNPNQVTIDSKAQYKTIDISGIQEKRYSGYVSSVGPGLDGAKSENIYFTKNDKIYSIEFIDDSENNFGYIDQILSTFKFTTSTSTINSFTACAAAGNMIMETYPEQCRTSDGVTFVKQYQACAQVITPAKNPKTQEVREFPTPCDVPVGWEKYTSETK